MKLLETEEPKPYVEKLEGREDEIYTWTQYIKTDLIKCIAAYTLWKYVAIEISQDTMRANLCTKIFTGDFA